jgi:DNA polymerase-3 subunit gamma/tau
MRPPDDMPADDIHSATAASSAAAPRVEYRVLARKYRPSTFAELIGHDTLVRTLSNAFAGGRIAHAFMLTGVRGVGKTTTARIIARALNCIGPDGKGGPTMTPCGQCDPCRTIAEDRHPDVIEMDAASRTGIDDIREVIDSVRYRPVSARYKIYIIDEVHMLSKAAFNALLKTLEEPPPDVKFVFATTEINKVPVTVLSRCQRYTLPRIPQQILADYYGSIAGKERVEVEPAALSLVARAADGSVRDGLSILDQAIALGAGGPITEEAVRDMLGVADRGLVFDLFDSVMAGNASEALSRLEVLYNGGTDPAMVLQDLLDIVHTVTRLKFETREATQSADDRQLLQRAGSFAQRLGIPILTRAWQMLLKGLAEVQAAPHPLKAAEMVLIRLVYVSDLPPPGDIVKAIQSGTLAPTAAGTGGGAPSPGGGNAPRARLDTIPGGGGAALALAEPRPVVAVSAAPLPQPATFAAMMALVAERREGILYALCAQHIHPVKLEPGLFEFRPTADAPRDLSTKLGAFLNEATGLRWLITVSRAEGQPTLRQQVDLHAKRQRAEAEADPLVQAALQLFPGAVIAKVTDLEPVPDAPPPAELVAEPVTAPLPEEESPALYEEDDPGPFAQRRDAYEPDDEEGDDR